MGAVHMAWALWACCFGRNALAHHAKRIRLFPPKAWGTIVDRSHIAAAAIDAKKHRQMYSYTLHMVSLQSLVEASPRFASLRGMRGSLKLCGWHVGGCTKLLSTCLPAAPSRSHQSDDQAVQLRASRHLHVDCSSLV